MSQASNGNVAIVSRPKIIRDVEKESQFRTRAIKDEATMFRQNKMLAKTDCLLVGNTQYSW